MHKKTLQEQRVAAELSINGYLPVECTGTVGVFTRSN
jgi:hypothetical protein